MDSTTVDTVPAKTAPRTAVAGYSKIEAGLADLRTKYADAVFDVRSAKGMAEARAARGTLRDTRLLLERTRVDEKADALAYGRLVDSEAARIAAAIIALETPIALQVQTEDNRKEAERRAKADAETARVEGIKRRVDWIRGRPLEAVGKTAAELHAAATDLMGLPLTVDLYAEFLPAALEARAVAHGKLTEMHGIAEASETEAVRLKDAREALEAEQRAAAEQRQREDKERQDRIDREDAERKYANDWDDAYRECRQRIEDAERARLQKIDDDARAAAQAEQDRKDADARAEQQRKDDEAAEQRRLDREALERNADPWTPLAKIVDIAYLNRDKTRDPVDVLKDCYVLADRAIDARNALAMLDKVAA